MFNKDELIAIGISTIVLAFASSLFHLFETFLISLLFFTIIIFGNTLFKKAVANYLDIQMKTKIWEVKQLGFKPHMKSKSGIAMGLFLSILTKIISLGHVAWSAVLTFDVKAKIYRSAKRHGLYAYTEISEMQIGLIAAIGIISTLLFALFGYILGYAEFARLALAYSFFNMLPLSNLDGNKIFFGNKTIWIFLETIILIGILITILSL